ncbi:MAG TPA: LysR substrate-binding domain-containing protein [Polyangiaceae bacterium]|nr:LysR substrate-binding domain-containing protein [Polyangiaceae bacterium]
MRYTLRQLQVFTAIARVESVSRAARALAMSQSAVSGALLDLERQFDVRLFERVGKRLTLSELGRALWPEAEALCEQARQLELHLAQQRSGELRVGATLTIGNHLCPPLMASFMRDDPGARVTLRIANTREITQAVKSFAIDVGLVEGELSDPELAVSHWRDDELRVFCSPRHPLAKKRRLTDADLTGSDWIVREPGSGTRQAFERALHGLLPELSIALELTQTEAILGAVEAGLGLGCVSGLALEQAFRSRTLMRCRVPHRNFRRSLFFVLHQRKFRSPALERWLELCRLH